MSSLLFCLTYLPEDWNILSSLVFDSSSSSSLFLCYSSQEKFYNALVILALTFPSLSICFLIHSNLPSFHPTPNLLKDECQWHHWFHVVKSIVTSLSLSYWAQCATLSSFGICKSQTSDFLLPHRLFFFSFLLSPTPLTNL